MKPAVLSPAAASRGALHERQPHQGLHPRQVDAARLAGVAVRELVAGIERCAHAPHIEPTLRLRYHPRGKGDSVKIGVTIHATDLCIPVAELAREAEARGFHSLYIPEHTHIPVSRRTPAPMGGELPEEYKRSPDPLVALAAAAAVTRRILLGTAVALPMQHDVIAYAKQVATLDRICGGRFVFGAGYGWNREEMQITAWRRNSAARARANSAGIAGAVVKRSGKF